MKAKIGGITLLCFREALYGPRAKVNAQGIGKSTAQSSLQSLLSPSKDRVMTKGIRRMVSGWYFLDFMQYEITKFFKFLPQTWGVRGVVIGVEGTSIVSANPVYHQHIHTHYYFTRKSSYEM